MGRKNKSYSKDLHQQAYEKLKGMQAFGQSKRDAMKDGTARDKIYSFSTYNTYWKHIKYFLRYMKATHPEVTTLKKAAKYVPEWLQHRCDQRDKNGRPLSAWTIHTETAAMAKLFGIKPTDPGRFQPPRRNRDDIVRSRESVPSDAHFSEKKNSELAAFCRGTGLRRSGVESVRGRDLVSKADVSAEIQRIEAIPEKQRTKDDLSRLSAYKDTMIFTHPSIDFFVRVREKAC